MNEFCKSSWELTKTPEFQAALQEMIAESNKNITHSEFVAGIENKTIGFKVMFGEPFQMLTGIRKLFFNIFVMLYMVAPFILIPIWAYIEHNWWLMIGVAISLIATGIASKNIYMKQKQNLIGGFLLFACIVCWIFFGFHNYFTFFTLCALWGYIFFCIADNCANQYLLQQLLENPDFFDDAIVQHKIMTVHACDL